MKFERNRTYHVSKLLRTLHNREIPVHIQIKRPEGLNYDDSIISVKATKKQKLYYDVSNMKICDTHKFMNSIVSGYSRAKRLVN